MLFIHLGAHRLRRPSSHFSKPHRFPNCQFRLATRHTSLRPALWVGNGPRSPTPLPCSGSTFIAALALARHTRPRSFACTRRRTISHRKFRNCAIQNLTFDLTLFILEIRRAARLRELCESSATTLKNMRGILRDYPQGHALKDYFACILSLVRENAALEV